MKIHYAYLERGNESNPHDEWSATFCGIEYTESPLTDNIKQVTCKKCLKTIQKIKNYETQR